MNQSQSNSSQFSLNNNDNDSDNSSTATLMTAHSHLSSSTNSRSSTPTYTSSLSSSTSNPYITNSRTSSYSDNQIITTTTTTTNNNLLFSLNDEGDDEEVDESSYYPPKPLKSTIPSKELEYELDSDELEESDRLSLEGGGGGTARLSRGGEEDEDEPLLMEGLLQSSIRRGSVDITRSNNSLSRSDRTTSREGDHSQSRKGASISSGIANMSNSILGAGIIGLPYATMSAGFFTGILLIIILGMVTDWTIRLIVLNSKMSGRHSYIDIVDSCFGSYGRFLVSFFQFAFAFGGMCAFCVILGDTIPHVLVSILPSNLGPFLTFLSSRGFVIVFLTMSVSFPLSLYRDIEKLSKASTFALISMVVIVVSVAIRGPGVEDSLKGSPDLRWTFLGSGVFEAIGVISFAFVCHHNSLLIYGSLATPTLDRFAKVTHISTMLSVVACLCMSTSGFLVFTSRTQGNILNNFSTDDTLINIARALFGANMFTTLPLEAFVCREVMETYFWPGEEFDEKRHVVITTSVVVGAMVVSLMTCDLGLILELAGGFSATALAYIFPAACYLKLSGNSKEQKSSRIAAYICTIFGISVMVLSTFLSITKAMKGGGTKVC